MRTRALLMVFAMLGSAALALAGAVAAEPASPPANGVIDGLSASRIVAIVRQNGFDPIGGPVRKGDIYTLLALDAYDAEYRLVIDAHTGRTVSLREIAAPGPYEPVPAFARIFGRPDDGLGSPRPPRAVPHAAPSPPKSTAVAAPAPNPMATPLPRPRPYVRDATGSIPVDAPNAAETKTAPAPQRAADDASSAALPPVAPLE